MDAEKKHINYTATDIEKYWTGQLSAAEQHAMEKAALDDPFLADAMEGYEEKSRLAKPVIAADNNELKKRLADSVAKKQPAPVVAFGWWKVAAVIVVMIGAGWLYNSVSNKSKDDGLVKKDEIKNESPAIVKADSASSDSDAIASGAANEADTLRDVAVNSPRKSATKNNAIANDIAKNDEAESRPAAPVAAAPAIANKQTETSRRNETASDKDDAVATLPAAKKEAPKSVAAEAPAQKAKVIATEDYKSNNNAIAGRSNAFSNTFNGNIIDQSNKPVANASIQIPNLNVATQTDKRGYFSFQAPDTSLSVSIASNGFETQNFHLRNNEATLNQIVLTPVPNELREVVVQSNGAERKKQAPLNGISIKILDAEPIIGWEAYNDYLEKNKKIKDEDLKKIHGTVTVAFQVRSKYLTNFEIEKSVDEDLDAEAIRLIKQGPAWKLLKGKKANVTIRVKF